MKFKHDTAGHSKPLDFGDNTVDTPDDGGHIATSLAATLARLGESIKKKNSEAPKEEAYGATPGGMRPAPKGDNQPDFFVPPLYDVGTKDARSLMDVAPFRLSKRDKRAGEVLRYDLPDGYVEIKSGPDGMASIWDYDILLMMVSHMTEAMNRYRDGKGQKPTNVYKPHTSEILKFCRRSHGGKQVEELEKALDRLQGTTIKSVREKKQPGGKKAVTLRAASAQGLIEQYRIASYTSTGRIAEVEIHAADWLYNEITKGKNPDVLTVDPDYFLIDSGIGRFVYRLARRAAGRTTAAWGFKLLYERSGSSGTLKKFTENLRKVISNNNLPEYEMSEEAGKQGPMLVMRHRDYIDAE